MSEAFRQHARTTLTGLLPRLRHTIEFPLDVKEVYRGAFPESKLADWLFDPLPTDFKRRGLAYRNMVACTHRGPIVHFLLNSQTELDAMTDDSDRAIFWIRFDHQVVSPHGWGAFQLSEALRCNKPLLDWYNAANRMEDRIDHFTLKVYKAVGDIQNPSEFALAWPEVVGAVPGIVPEKATLRAAARSSRIPKLRRKILSTFPLGEGGEMDEFTSMLAAAIMLPKGPYPMQWVGLYPSFDEDLP